MFKALAGQPNGWIEASAGTGKTYTIQQLVLEILCTSDTPIDEILLVTFTEKAAGEMRERIREGLIATVKGGELHSVALGEQEFQRLARAVRDFEMAEIYTIHGWCKKVIQKVPFESGRSFQEKLSDEREIIVQEVMELLKGEWSKEYPELVRLLQESSYIDVEKIVSSVFVSIAEQKHEHDSVVGEHLTPFVASVDACVAKLGPDGVSLFKNFAALQREVALEHKTSFNKTRKLPKFDEWTEQFVEALPGVIEECRRVERPEPLLDFIKTFKSGKENIGWLQAKCDDPSFDFENENYFPLCHGKKYSEIVSAIEVLISDAESYLREEAAQTYIPILIRLIEKVAETKESQSLFTFNDMIHRVRTMVTTDNDIARRIRAQYGVVLVDEFQDTDDAQWEIFKILYLKDLQTQLFLIGDPKQAIYSFRGADIATYFTAKKEMLDHSGSEIVYTLAENYRSSRRILEAFNGIFARPSFFGSDGDDGQISYTPVGYPDASPAQQPGTFYERFALNESYAPFVIKELVEDGVGKCREAYYPWMVNALVDLKSRGAQWSDMAILVQKRGDVELFESLLQDAGIPYSYYKQQGVYQSIESAHILYVLESILGAVPSAITKALFTPFFEKGNSVPGGESGPSDSDRKLYDRWHQMVGRKKWGELYHSLLHDTTLLQNIASSPNRFRQLDVYKQIMQDLQTKAYGQKLTLSDQVALLKNWRAERLEREDDGELYRKERDDAAVQIMTMHASKGLEFNVVFMGGFGELQGNDYSVIKEGNHRIFDFTQKEPVEQKLPEYTRLLYVAMTRAKYYLYMPLFGSEKISKKVGMHRVLTPAITGALNNELDGYVTINPKYDQRELVVTGQEVTKASTSEKSIIPEYDGFSKKKIIMESYSHLSHTIHEQDRSITSIGVIPTAPRPALFDKYIQDIPRGAEPGNCLHDIFEHISFAEVGAASNSDDPAIALLHNRSTAEVIEFYCTKYGIGSVHYRAIARLVHNCLTAPMIDTRDTFDTITLAEIPEKDLKAEMEFQFSYLQSDTVRLFTKNEDAHFVKGFIDLLFRHKGRYYILDWKSNYLENGYDAGAIEESMLRDHYDIQLKVYALALHKWLQSALPGYSFDTHFGGVYYLYIRGMQPGSNDGYVCMCPESSKVIEEQYSQEIEKMIGDAHPEAGEKRHG
ncbi:MAG: UvrD-helicase domain-containing protein [Fibrobacterales bacterium]